MHPIPESISLTQLRTQSKRLQSLLAANKALVLTRGSRRIGVVLPLTTYQKQAASTPNAYLNEYDIGGDFKTDLTSRSNFYE